jgi:TFIIB zinc-binding
MTTFAMASAYRNELEDDRRCHHCTSQNLRVDWSQGDRICTDCGVVNESHLLDDRPEWRDFCEAEDLVKGLPSGARSGLVVVDETRYPGGLQPTSLSKQPYGNPLQGSANIRKSLNATNRRMDHYMERERKKALKGAKLSLLLKRKNIAVKEHGICPEHDAQVLQNEEEANLAHLALHQEKWSLERALLLHGDLASGSLSAQHQEERSALVSRLDKSLKRASSDLYLSYSILRQAAQHLELAPHIVQHATHTLCKYANKNDGLTVKGVASRLSKSNATSKGCLSTTENLREYNRLKQMAALASALLFLEARKHGHVRSLQDVCASFQEPCRGCPVGISRNASFLKPKHCNKAMKELRLLFPDYMCAAISEKQENGDNFIEHATRKLDLPPVATASIQILVGKIREKKKLPLAGAAVTLLVCMAGTIMQRLARQAMQPNSDKCLKTSDDIQGKPTKAPHSELEKGGAMAIQVASFDLFLQPAIADPSYEMRQMWDAWVEQMPWGRSIVSLEHAFKISRNLVLELFKTELYPQRFELLSVLQESVELRSIPRATLLLSQMSIASPLLNCQGKV